MSFMSIKYHRLYIVRIRGEIIMKSFTGVWRKLDTLKLKLPVLLLVLSIIPLYVVSMLLGTSFTDVVRDKVKQQQE